MLPFLVWSLFCLRMVILTFFWFPLAWTILSHPFTLRLNVSLELKWVFCKHHIVEPYFLSIQSLYAFWLVNSSQLYVEWLLVHKDLYKRHLIIGLLVLYLHSSVSSSFGKLIAFPGDLLSLPFMCYDSILVLLDGYHEVYTKHLNKIVLFLWIATYLCSPIKVSVFYFSPFIFLMSQFTSFHIVTLTNYSIYSYF